MIKWNKTSIEQKILRLKLNYKPGISARGIAEALSSEFGTPITRNTIIGIYQRNPALKISHPLLSRGEADSAIVRAVKARSSRNTAQEPVKRSLTRAERIQVKRFANETPYQPARPVILAEDAKIYDESRLEASLALVELTSRQQCRFPVASAPIRFCAEVTRTGSSYCEHHTNRCNKQV